MSNPFDYYKTGVPVFNCNHFSVSVNFEFIDLSQSPFKDFPNQFSQSAIDEPYYEPTFAPFVQHPHDGSFYILMPNQNVNYSFVLSNTDAPTSYVSIKVDNKSIGDDFVLKSKNSLTLECAAITVFDSQKESKPNPKLSWIVDDCERSNDDGLIEFDVQWESFFENQDNNLSWRPHLLYGSVKEASTSYIQPSNQKFYKSTKPRCDPNKRTKLIFRMIPWNESASKIKWITPFSIFPPFPKSIS